MVIKIFLTIFGRLCKGLYWVEDWEKESIIDFYRLNPTEGYRRVTYMMIDADIVAVSPSKVYRILSSAGMHKKWNRHQ